MAKMNQKPLKNQTDIRKIFGIRDFIDQQECEANCLLCFTTFSLHDIEEHIESDYHKILDKVTDVIIERQESNVAYLNVKEIPKLNADQKLTDKYAKTASRDESQTSDMSPKMKAIPLPYKETSQKNADQKLTDKYAETDSEDEFEISDECDYSEISDEYDYSEISDESNNSEISDESDEFEMPDKSPKMKAIPLPYKETPNKLNSDQKLTDKFAKTIRKHEFKMSDESTKIKAIPLPFKENSHKYNADQKLIDQYAETVRKDEFKTLNDKKKSKSSPIRVDFYDFTQHHRFICLDGIVGFLFDEKIFIEGSSFFLTKQVGQDHLFCLRCESYFGSHHLHEFHSDEDDETELKTTMIKLENEFIREIKPNKFHCGHCNLVKSGWDEMEKHLNSTEHDRRRGDSNSFTQKIKYEIKQDDLKRKRFLDFFRSFPF